MPSSSPSFSRSLSPSPSPVESRVNPDYRLHFQTKYLFVTFPAKKQDTLVGSTSRDRRNQPPPRRSPAPRRMTDAPEFHASVEASGDPRVRIAATAIEEYESEKRPSRSRARVVRGAPVSSSERRSIRFDRWAVD